MFQQLLASKRHWLRDSKLGRVKAWVWSPTNRKKKPWVNHEPRSAHGRVVKNVLVLLFLYIQRQKSMQKLLKYRARL